MNYRNGKPTDVAVVPGAFVRKQVKESRYNTMFMTYDELQKIWEKKQELFIGELK